MTDPGRLFVYGTLVPGGRYWSVVDRFVEGNVSATTTGTLYDTGAGYPGAIFHEPGGLIHGAVLEFAADVVGEALMALDRFEGAEYRRVVVTTTAGAAWGYEWAQPVTGLVTIASGRYG